MALSTTNVQITGLAGSDVAALATEFNNLLDELRVWATRLDAETLADSDYASRLDAAVNKIANASGTEQ